MTLREGILATLRYSDHFAFPLTLPELHSRLIRLRISSLNLQAELSRLVAVRRIGERKGYYFLPGRLSLINSRLRRARLSAPLLTRALKLSRLISLTPGVLAVYLTGSLAMHNTNGLADIDLMIIARSGRLWTTRLLLTLATTLLGIRRTPHSSQNSGKLCLNLYLTPASYLLPPAKQNLYTAYELIQAKPLYDPHHTRPTLLASNPWVKKYLPNYPFPLTVFPQPGATPRHSLLESLCYRLQSRYMRARVTREHITPDSAFFHPHDPSPGVK